MATLAPQPLPPPWARAVQTLQDNVFLNKTFLEGAGVDLPMITLARNPQERREVAFKLGLTTLIAFILAPVHARLIAQLASHLHGGLDSRLLFLAYDELKTPAHLAQGLQRLNHEVLQPNAPPLPRPQPLAYDLEPLRQQIIKGKTLLLGLDVMVETLCLLNLGWIKNWFSYKQTGKKQFTGEMGAVSQPQLDALYQHQATIKQSRHPRLSARTRQLLLNAAAVVTPLALGALFRQSFKSPAEAASPVMQPVRTLATHFNNHSKGYTMGLGSYMVSCLFLCLGEYSAARSDNERLEVVLKKTPLFLSYFYGDRLIHHWLNKLLPATGYTSESSVTRTLNQVAQPLKLKAGKRAAALYLASYTLNTGLVAGVIYLTNRLTRQRVRAQVAQLPPVSTAISSNTSQTTSPVPTVRVLPATPNAVNSSDAYRPIAPKPLLYIPPRPVFHGEAGKPVDGWSSPTPTAP